MLLDNTSENLLGESFRLCSVCLLVVLMCQEILCIKFNLNNFSDPLSCAIIRQNFCLFSTFCDIRQNCQLIILLSIHSTQWCGKVWTKGIDLPHYTLTMRLIRKCYQTKLKVYLDKKQSKFSPCVQMSLLEKSCDNISLNLKQERWAFCFQVWC